jgi:hypothetical protein
MPKPFDATLKAMLDESPADWVEMVGRPRAPAALVDADVLDHPTPRRWPLSRPSTTCIAWTR